MVFFRPSLNFFLVSIFNSLVRFLKGKKVVFTKCISRVLGSLNNQYTKDQKENIVFNNFGTVSEKRVRYRYTKLYSSLVRSVA